MDKIYFQWHITDVCNFRCRHCYQDSFGSDTELDIKGLKTVSGNIFAAAKSQNQKVVINITGGEPFLKKELFSFLDYLNSRQELAQLAIITNASLIDDKTLKELKKINKLNQIKISLEGPDASFNDAVRGPGSFDKAIGAIKLLKKESAFSVVIMNTVMKSNLKGVAGLFDLCQDLALDGLIIERFLPLGSGANIKEGLLDENDWKNLVNLLLGLTEEPCVLEDLLPQRAFWIKFSGNEVELLGARCNIGKDAFCIMPDGSVFPCRRFTLKIGNLLKNALVDIQNSQVLREIITAKKKGRCSNCDIPACRGCAALSYLLTGDYLAQDIMCAYRKKIPQTLKTGGRET